MVSYSLMEIIKQIASFINCDETRKQIIHFVEVIEMANIKSAKKRIEVAKIRTERNKAIKSKVKTAVKKVDAAIANNDKAAATEALKLATKTIDLATSKGVFHKNTASRKVSRLASSVSKMA